MYEKSNWGPELIRISWINILGNEWDTCGYQWHINWYIYIYIYILKKVNYRDPKQQTSNGLPGESNCGTSRSV